MVNRDINLNSRALERAWEYTYEFYALLVLQAKILARKPQVDVVSIIHIDDARKFIIDSGQRRAWLKEFMKVIGGACFGAFLKVVFEKLSTGSNILTVEVATVGILGAILITLGVKR